jgi:outer membrane lipoprotein-sorting protein
MLPSFPMTRAEAIRRLEQISRDSQGIQNLNAKVTVQAKIGGVRTPTMSTSPSLDGTLLLQRPDNIRLRTKIFGGLATVFDLVSNGQTYRFLIPERKQLWEGKESGPPVGAISNDQMINTFVTLRPKQVQDAVLINVLPLIENSATQVPVESVAVREDRKVYYVVYFTNGSHRESRIVEKVWFDLSTDKQAIVRRQTFKDNGEVDADVRYFEWGKTQEAGISIPAKIEIEFPDREIVLIITVDPASAVVNGKLSDSAFDLDSGNAEIKTLPLKGIASTP